MPRIRSIKPEFWTSDQIMDLSLNARLCFIGLWNFCDDSGRMKSSVRRVKSLLFSGDDVDSVIVHGWINELLRGGLLIQYHVDSVDYWQVTGWHHQRINRPAPSQYPAPTAENKIALTDCSLIDHAGSDRIGSLRDPGSEGMARSDKTGGPISDRSVNRSGNGSHGGSPAPDKNGNLDLGEPEPGAAPRVVASMILNSGETFDVDEVQAGVWQAQYPYLDVEQQLQKMSAHCEANPRKRKTGRGIKPFIVRWLNREVDGR